MPRAHRTAIVCFLTLAAWLGAGEQPAPGALPVNMLVPGFTVRELPLQITNLNNLEYTPDGRLFALGYDGRVHILTDSDGDGLEDQDKIYWNNAGGEFRGAIGMLLTPEGVYVSSKGKVSLLPDADGDGVADKLEVIATGWKEISQNVDALGVAKDAQGNLYFGLGCANFANPYMVDKATGKAAYDIKSERGTILKVSPDRKTREIVCTGIRFPVSLKFNRHGDLFATDQEGATWCPGGNTADELVHIIPGRHYGFPPRHPEHLPNVVDEPNVVSFGPQHQSTCGMKFNEAKPLTLPSPPGGEGKQPTGGDAGATWKSFGPDFWEGDALVTGESRGKIYRCKLVKTPSGYVGSRPYIIACLKMLTVDLAVSPKGDLVVCCHSGPPDWGTGPKGIGRIFKISYTDRKAPQPVIAWAAGPQEVRVAFDKPLDPSIASSVLELRAGEFVRAGDRYETLVPPYVAVKAQLSTAWRPVKVLSQKLSEDGRTLIVSTEALPWRSTYALAIPGVKAAGAAGFGATVDVDFELTGMEASINLPKVAHDVWTGWLPHPDTAVIDTILGPSESYKQLKPYLSNFVNLGMGTTLELSGKEATFSFESNGGRDFYVFGRTSKDREGADPVFSTLSDKKVRRARIKQPCDAGPILIAASVCPEPGKALAFHVSYHTDADPNERPLRTDQLVLSWAAKLPRQPVPTETNPFLQVPATRPPNAFTAGGDWERGRAIFTGEGKCAACHALRGEGGQFGPDLSNLAFRDPESVLRDILDPNISINPDYVSYVVVLADGNVLTGLVQPAGEDQYRIVVNAEKVLLIKKSDVRKMKPSAVSIMPQGFKELLGPEKLKDLLMFLTGEPPKPPTPPKKK